ncbi:S24 family peptidase [Sphingobium fluviale]|uniref:S24 family peptidase n=1 Tax=Sphingobium fluviale TaxID=2506423 RepID=A0A4Q1KGT5_9SPHN|nr:S24 family peptidase [Sphingobium fluviale]
MRQCAIIGLKSQVKISDNRDCQNRLAVSNNGMTSELHLRPEIAEVFKRMEALGLQQKELADALGLEANKISKTKAGERQFKAHELLAAREWLKRMEVGAYRPEPDLPLPDEDDQYVRVSVLPTYAGAGGGGNGDGDSQNALISRILVEDMLRGRAEDFVIINIRGDSMEPDFHHGDQLLVDRRDVSPSQPGPFAVWDGEWGEYVVKNIERLPGGRVRMFSSNSKYSPAEIQHEATRIIGRPVWFGRRL